MTLPQALGLCKIKDGGDELQTEKTAEEAKAQ